MTGKSGFKFGVKETLRVGMEGGGGLGKVSGDPCERSRTRVRESDRQKRDVRDLL